MSEGGSCSTVPSVGRRLRSEESGQVMIITGFLLVVMLVATALVVDIGHTMLVQRQLQAGVDAAALAGAQGLPVDADASQIANEFSPTPGSKNAVNTVDNAVTTVNVRCITALPGCNTRYASSNAITVSATSSVPTFFGRIVGVDSLGAQARATACFPCSIRPLDIMIVLDRTGSMCQGGPGDNANSDPQRCRDLDAARSGVATFISLMDPKLVRVGLALSPPATGPSSPPGPDSPDDACAKPTSANPPNNYFGYDAWAPFWETAPPYRSQDRAFYVVSSLSDDDVDNEPADDYVQKVGNDWILNGSSDIVSKLACVKSAGSTSYSLAIDEATRELAQHGRADVQDVIVFFTDGGANTTHDNGTHWSGNSPWFNRPCGSGVKAAGDAKQVADSKGRHLAFYTIGYDLANQHVAGQRCNRPASNGHQDNGQPQESNQAWGRTPTQALQAMASVPENFFTTDDPEALQNLFYRVAGEVLSNAARLVDSDLPDLIE